MGLVVIYLKFMVIDKLDSCLPTINEIKLGLELKYGIIVIYSQDEKVYFSKPFKNKCVFVSIQDTGSVGTCSFFNVHDFNVDFFRVSANGNPPDTFYWLAIGY